MTAPDESWGLPPNSRNRWDLASRGYKTCGAAKPATLSVQNHARAYYMTSSPTWDEGRGSFTVQIGTVTKVITLASTNGRWVLSSIQ